jgi:hypothetical protein
LNRNGLCSYQKFNELRLYIRIIAIKNLQSCLSCTNDGTTPKGIYVNPKSIKIYKLIVKKVVIIGAHVKYNFKKGFLLDEEKLRKIHDIISKRIKDNDVKYSVFREDAFSFETTKIEDIINEENLKGSRINEIRINQNKKNETLDFSLIFDDSGTRLVIDGENRDAVFLLSSELKEYISNEVCILRSGTSTDFRFSVISIANILILVGLVITLGSLFPTTNNEAIQKILESNDTNEKINLLIQDRFQGRTSSIATFSPIIIILLVISFFSTLFYNKINRFVSYILPTNLFLFGKEFERYKQRLETKSKIFWVLFAGLIIAILAGLIVWYITLKR